MNQGYTHLRKFTEYERYTGGSIMFIEKSLQEYLNVAASGKEVPGGGSVSAVIAALGTSMGEMVANFTKGKKKYAEFEEEINLILVELSGIRNVLLACVDRDAEAFLQFNNVYDMPKDTEHDKEERTKAMQSCLFGAMQPPMDIMRLSLRALKLLPVLASKGNQNLITDAGVAAIGLFAGMKAARYNVLINLKWLKDKQEVQVRKDEVAQLLSEATKIVGEIEAKIEDAL